MVTPASVVVLASGSGTLLASLLAACRADDYPATVAAVGVDRDCGATGYAEAAGVPHFRVEPAAHPDRAAWDAALTEAVAGHRPDWVVSAGPRSIASPRISRKIKSFGR